MNPIWRKALWQQYGAAIDMLDNAIVACPDEVWIDPSKQPQFQFWYVVFHTLFFLDLYLSETEEGFAPPAPFTLDELDPAGIVPEPYTRDQLRRYLVHGRAKCRATIDAMTDEHAATNCHFGWLDISAIAFATSRAAPPPMPITLSARCARNAAAPSITWLRTGLPLIPE